MDRLARWSQRIADHLQVSSFSPAVVSLVQSYLVGIESKNASYHHKALSPSVQAERKKAVYANNYLNFGEVNVVGFDLDYTLLSYSTDLQELIYNHARDALTVTYGFPQEMRSCKFNPSFAIRGLSVDIKHGTVCKLSHVQKVGLHLTFKVVMPFVNFIFSNQLK